LQPLGDQLRQPLVVRLTDVMRIEALELLHVEARGRLADLGQVEPGDRLLAADDLVVAVAPAEPQKIVEQGFGEDAHLAIVVDAERAVALAELGAVGAVDQRDVGVGRLRPAHCPDDRQLAEGVVEMIVAADDVGDAHVMVVDDHR
jgi:hypothetical protein